MNNFIFLMGSTLIFIFLYIFYKLIENKIKFDQRMTYIKEYTTCLSILNYNLKKAYSIIYKEKIMVYSMDGSKLGEKEYIEASKSFCVLVFRMIGPKLKNDLLEIYGNEETLLFNLVSDFNERYENDEIYKSTSTDLINETKLGV